MPSAPPPFLRFGNHELDPQSGELRRAGRRVPLARQPFAVLTYLAHRAGEVVSREELRRHIWGTDTFVDFERGLNFCILQIRRALDDDARSPRFIETLPRRGYRLLAPVESVHPAGDVVEVPPTHRKARRSPRWLLATTLALAVLASVALLHRSTLPPPPTGRVKLAVLPFENLSADPEQSYFCDGMTEELIAQLGGVDPRRLGVIARTSVERYRSGARDLGEIGRRLDVAYVVEGSVRREGGRVRITAQLIQVHDRTQLWSQIYERNQWGALVIQREVAQAVARALELELLPAGRSLPDRAGSHHPQAHDAYLKGRYLQRKGTVDALERSLEYFTEASGLDPAFALPRAALANTWHRLVMAGRRPPLEAYPKALDAARKALELDPLLAEAHLALGRVTLWFHWRPARAAEHFRRALELNPSAAAHHDLGWSFIAQGLPDLGLAELDHAREIDPLSPTVQVDTGWALIQAGHFGAAVERCERTLELEPGLALAEQCRDWARLLDTRDAAAEAVLERRLEQQLSDPDDTNPRAIAVSFALLGRPDQAFEWLEEAYSTRRPAMVLLGVEPAFAGLREDARFQRLLERTRAPSR